MTCRIRIIIKSIILDAELFDTATAKAIAEILPIKARPNEWGDEFYFSVNVIMPLDNTATTKVKVGDIGYWPPGNALAIFFGRTPLSIDDEPVPASKVNLVGRIIGDPKLLKNARGADCIIIEKL